MYLIEKLCAAGSGLLGGGGVMLYHSGYLFQALGNFFHGFGLALRKACDFRNLFVHFLRTLHNLRQGLCGFLGHLRTGFDGTHGVFNEGGGVLCRLCGLSGKISNFIRNYGEAPTELSGSCRLNGCI